VFVVRGAVTAVIWSK